MELSDFATRLGRRTPEERARCTYRMGTLSWGKKQPK
jgi:hypothetical protein